VLAAEQPSILVLVDRDLRTDMQQAAFPGEDIDDRPLPEERAGFVRLLGDDHRAVLSPCSCFRLEAAGVVQEAWRWKSRRNWRQPNHQGATRATPRLVPARRRQRAAVTESSRTRFDELPDR
jgi:hypothetical protein